MTAIIPYNPALSQKTREYLIQLEDYLKLVDSNNHDLSDVLLYLDKLITLHASIDEVTTQKAKVPK